MPVRRVFLFVLAVLLALLWGAPSAPMAVDILEAPVSSDSSDGTLHAADYGVVCDDTTDTTPMLQAAITDARTLSTIGLTLAMPEGGQCKLNSTVVVSGVAGLHLRGNGVVFRWGGNTTTPMFLFQDARDTVFEDFQVNTNPGTPVHTVFQYENRTGLGVTPTGNRLRNIYVECTNGGCLYGIRSALGSAGDNNNDFLHVEKVTFSNYTTACASLEHSQSKHNKFRDVSCHSNGLAPCGIQTTTNGGAASFDAEGFWMLGHTTADFCLKPSTDPINILGGSSEGSARLLAQSDHSTAMMPITISGYRFACIPGNFAADGEVISYRQNGPFVLTGNIFEPVQNCGALSINFRPNFGAGPGTFIATGNSIGSTLANPFTGIQPNVSAANIIDRNDGNGRIPLESNLRLGPSTFAQLGTVPWSTALNGNMTFCPDCSKTAVCTGGGTGAIAKRLNNQWICD